MNNPLFRLCWLLLLSNNILLKRHPLRPGGQVAPNFGGNITRQTQDGAGDVAGNGDQVANGVKDAGADARGNIAEWARDSSESVADGVIWGWCCDGDSGEEGREDGCETHD